LRQGTLFRKFLADHNPFTMKSLLILLLAIFAIISCIPFDFPNLGTDTVEKGEYDIRIFGPKTDTRLVGKNVDTQWIPEDGWIFLNTEEKDSLRPIGTVTLVLNAFVENNHSITRFSFEDGSLTRDTVPYFSLKSALVSKTEKRRGTAAELDAKLFEISLMNVPGIGEIPSGTVHDVQVGQNFIRGTISMQMHRLLLNPNDPNAEPEVVLVQGTFTAMSR